MREGWTPEENMQLYELNRQGLSDKEIGKIMHYDRSTICEHRNKLGITPAFPFIHQRRESRRYTEGVRKLWKTGMTIGQIAEEVGCSKGTVCNKIKKFKAEEMIG